MSILDTFTPIKTNITTMINIHYFTFNGFQENTYILYDSTKECVIIDPGCYSNEEQQVLANFITENELTPVKLLNTHCHIDHILGNNFVATKYNIGLEMHEKDLPTLHATPEYGHTFGFNVDKSPEPTRLLKENDIVKFGNAELSVLFTPGHSAGHIVPTQTSGIRVTNDRQFRSASMLDQFY